jgi:D-methionine transport system ATP-binding protein
MDDIIQFKNISKKFTSNKSQIHAVNNVSFNIPESSIFGIIGKSGAGKSTLLRTINALETVDSGHVTVNKKDITKISRKNLRKIRGEIGMIFQHFNLFSSKTVLNNVMFPLNIKKNDKKKNTLRALEVLDFVGLKGYEKRYPYELSGGQKQRVAIARALSTNPKILLADEPTSALDPEITDEILSLLRRINKKLGITEVIITHDMSVIKQVCSHVAVLDKGNLIEYGEIYNMFSMTTDPVVRKFISAATNDVPDARTISI